MSKRSTLVPVSAILLGVGCFGEPAPPAPPAVQRMVDHYAPTIVIGARLSDAARSRYALTPAPYLGYRDTTYVGSDGVRGLGLRVNEYVDDADPSVSRWARVTGVILQVPDTSSLAAVRRRLTDSLGAPVLRCRLTLSGSGTASLAHELLWDGEGKGAFVSYTYSPAPTESMAVALNGFDSGWVSFGMDSAVRESSDTIPCGPAAIR